MTCELEVTMKNSKETNITPERYIRVAQRTLEYTRQVLICVYVFSGGSGFLQLKYFTNDD